MENYSECSPIPRTAFGSGSKPPDCGRNPRLKRFALLAARSLLFSLLLLLRCASLSLELLVASCMLAGSLARALLCGFSVGDRRKWFRQPTGDNGGPAEQREGRRSDFAVGPDACSDRVFSGHVT